ncbi:MAG TPA: hypothetical protein PKX40_18460 [Spirochaetota bacterium]|nr:hypothetical protein [Spirochaetota bacterium]
MNIEINHMFLKVLTNSLDTGQTNYLGERMDSRFNVYRVSGFHDNAPLPRRTAAEVLINYFKTEDNIVRLFTIMLENEGKRFYNAVLKVWGKQDFINLLLKNKWIYDPEVKRFLLDPFYEHEINFLKKIRILDLRHEVDIPAIIKEIKSASATLSVKDLEWRITIRLYDMEPQIGELIRKILDMLLARQNLQNYTHELYACLKELAINASKANYKILFEKHVARPQKVTQERDYFRFLRMFQEEIEENGNKRLIELARQEDRFINITFQSSLDSIAIWVTNSQNISLIEKQALLKKLKKGEFKNKDSFGEEPDYAEGAGFGLNLILSILKNYTRDEEPLKVVFYPDFIKIGFELTRDELMAKIIKKDGPEQESGS